MDPREVRIALAQSAEEALMVVASGYPIEELGASLEQLSELLPGIAICHLLDSGDVTKFRDNLARSAFARRYFLSQSVQSGNSNDPRLALSRTEAFFDALAAGHGLLAREIATLSGQTWHETWEYREDFIYILFLHRIVMDRGWLSTPEASALLAELEQLADGADVSRGSILRAFIAGDSDGFNSALSTLTTEQRAELDEQKERLGEPDLPTFMNWSRTFVSIEGLALIAIARALKMAVPEDIPRTPLIARLEFSEPAVEDPFVTIEHLRRSGA